MTETLFQTQSIWALVDEIKFGVAPAAVLRSERTPSNTPSATRRSGIRPITHWMECAIYIILRIACGTHCKCTACSGWRAPASGADRVRFVVRSVDTPLREFQQHVRKIYAFVFGIVCSERVRFGRMMAIRGVQLINGLVDRPRPTLPVGINARAFIEYGHSWTAPHRYTYSIYLCRYLHTHTYTHNHTQTLERWVHTTERYTANDSRDAVRCVRLWRMVCVCGGRGLFSSVGGWWI